MIEVYQTKAHNPPKSYGNCFRACIASILEIDIESMPHFEWMGLEQWNRCFAGWLEDNNLCAAVSYVFDDEGKETRIPLDKLEGVPGLPAGYSILTGRSPRGDWDHCVVALDGLPVFDPASQLVPYEGPMLLDVRDYMVFEKRLSS